MPEIKRVTLHPLKSDGTVDTSINLYPKTLADGIVDRNGNPVDIATQVELNEAVNFVENDVNVKVSEINNNIRVINRNINALNTEVATKASEEDLEDLADVVAEKVNMGEVDLNEYLSEESLSTLVNFLDHPEYFRGNDLQYTKEFPLDNFKDCQTIKAHYKGVYDVDPEEEISWAEVEGVDAFNQYIQDFVISGTEIPLPYFEEQQEDPAPSIITPFDWTFYADTNKAGSIILLSNDSDYWKIRDINKYIYKHNCLNAWAPLNGNFNINNYRNILQNDNWSCGRSWATSIWWGDTTLYSEVYIATKGSITLIFTVNQENNEFEFAIFDTSRNGEKYYSEGYLFFNREETYINDDTPTTYFSYKNSNFSISLYNENVYCENTSDELFIDINEHFRTDIDKVKLASTLRNQGFDIENNENNYIYIPSLQQTTYQLAEGVDMYDYDTITLSYYCPWVNVFQNDCSPYQRSWENYYRWIDEEIHSRDDDLCEYYLYRNNDYQDVYKVEFYPDPDEDVSGDLKDAPTWTDEQGNEHQYFKLANNGDSLSVNFNIPKKCIGRIYLDAIMDNWNQASNKDKAVVGSDGVIKCGVNLYRWSNGGKDYVIGEYPEEYYARRKYREWLGEDDRTIGNYTHYSYDGYIPWFDWVEFMPGKHTIEYVRDESYSLIIKGIVIILQELPEEEIDIYDNNTFLNFKKQELGDDNTRYSYVADDSWTRTTVSYDLWDDEIKVKHEDSSIAIKYPNLEFDDNDKPIDAGKFLQLSYNSAYDKFEYIHTSAQAPINDLNQIRQYALYSINDNAKSYVKSKIASSINDFKASENYWTAAQHFSASIYANNAYINTLYGSNNVSKPVSQIALLSDIPDDNLALYTFSMSDVASVEGNVYTLTSSFRDIVIGMKHRVIIPRELGFFDDIDACCYPIEKTVMGGDTDVYLFYTVVLTYPYVFIFQDTNGVLTISTNSFRPVAITPEYQVSDNYIGLGDTDRAIFANVYGKYLNGSCIFGSNEYYGSYYPYDQNDLAQNLIYRLDSGSILPSASGAYAPDFITLSQNLYAKEIISGSYSYKKIYPLNYSDVGALSSATVIPDITGLASESYVNSAISALSSVYAPAGNYVDVEDLVSKQDVPAIEEDEYFRIPEPIFSADILRSTLERSLDPEFVEKLIGEPGVIESHQYVDNFGEVWKFETTDNGADIILIVGDIKYTTSVTIETDTDTEAGGSYVVVGAISVEHLLADLDCATEDDVYKAMGILNLDDEEIDTSDNSLVLSDTDTVDEDNHMADLDESIELDPIMH